MPLKPDRMNDGTLQAQSRRQVQSGRLLETAA